MNIGWLLFRLDIWESIDHVGAALYGRPYMNSISKRICK